MFPIEHDKQAIKFVMLDMFGYIFLEKNLVTWLYCLFKIYYYNNLTNIILHVLLNK